MKDNEDTTICQDLERRSSIGDWTATLEDFRTIGLMDTVSLLAKALRNFSGIKVKQHGNILDNGQAAKRVAKAKFTSLIIKAKNY